MSDDPLDDLRAALRRETPAPRDPARQAALRAAAEAYARENPHAAQGSEDAARRTGHRAGWRTRLAEGALTMIHTMTRPRALMATSALATLVVAVVITQDLTPSNRPAFPERGEADGSRAPAPVPAAEEEAAKSSALLDAATAPESRAAPAEGRARQSFAAEPAAPPPALREAPADIAPTVESDAERYPDAEPGGLKQVQEEPVSTFSIDVDTASYAVVRSSLQAGRMPPEGAVRIEEMLNYFDYDYPQPESREVPFRTSVSVAPTPWNADTRLLHIGIQGYDLPAAERPPLNLVFLVDTSGSMNDPQKLPLLVRSFGMLLERLRPEDSVAVVTYAGSAGLALPPTPADERVRIMAALESLGAGGSTAGQAGLEQAYAVARRMTGEGELSRVILATDGDFNVGLSDPAALEDFIAARRADGTYLSVLGFGRGNYDDATMQALAQAGNGFAAYIDTAAEAQKVLVEDVAGALFPIADDVKIQVEFNPAEISEYRLIGYETRALERQDFANDAVDAGEIGAGHTVTALYEITPRGSAAERIGDLRYQPEDIPAASGDGELAYLKLRYKLPGEDASHLIETPVTADRTDIPAPETRFAAAVAGFGALLRGETWTGSWGYVEARALAAEARGPDPYGYRSELVGLIRTAGALD